MMPTQANPKAHPPDEVRYDKKMQGRVARLNKGYGFIEGEDGVDYFFHWSELSRFSRKFNYLKAGDQVEFQPGKTNEGPRAFSVLTQGSESAE